MNTRLEFLSEKLEKRRLLAGNVTASVNSADEIVIQGDAADNLVAIESPDGNFVWLRGAEGTTINGEEGPLLIGANGELDRDVRIQMRGGDDQFAFNGVRLLGQVQLAAGGGDDLMLVNETFAFDQLEIDLGSGNDRFGVANTVLQRELAIKGRSGDDYLQFTSVVATDDINVLMHGGDDTLVATSATVLGRFDVRDLGAGDDEVAMTDFDVRESLHVSLNSGDDTVLFQDSEGMRLEEFVVQTGGGNDTLEFKYLGLEASPLEIDTGGGDDNLVMQEVHGRRDLEISMQSGDDSATLELVEIYASDIPTDFQLSLGSGADTLTGRFVYFSGNAHAEDSELLIDSGSGDDRLQFDYLSAYDTQASLVTGRGNDLVAFAGEYEGGYFDHFEIDLGEGADQLSLQSLYGHDLEIRAGAGNDVLLIETGEFLEVERLSIDAGNGRDVLAIRGFEDDFEVDNFQANLGGQSDELYVMADLPLSGSINGGAGIDTFQEDLSVQVHLQPESFENVLPDQPLGVVWANLRLDFLAAWVEAGGEPGDLS